MSDPNPWVQVLSIVLPVFLGVALGIPAGLLLNQLIEQRRLKREETGLLRAVESAVEENLQLCSQLAAIISSNSTPTFSMNPGVLDALTPRLAQISGDIEVAREIEGFRYQVHHLDRKLDLWVEWWFRNFGPSMARSANRAAVIGTVQASVGVVNSAGQNLLPKLRSRISTLT